MKRVPGSDFEAVAIERDAGAQSVEWKAMNRVAIGIGRTDPESDPNELASMPLLSICGRIVIFGRIMEILIGTVKPDVFSPIWESCSLGYS